MLLMGVEENQGWLSSRWQLTYPQSWEKMCKAVFAMYDVYTQPEILLDNEPVKITSKEELLNLKESGSITIRGFSTIIQVPLMLTFINQSKVVNVTVAMAVEEFSAADYQAFKQSLGQYMDSIEISMYV